jgi:hypothetical protein
MQDPPVAAANVGRKTRLPIDGLITVAVTAAEKPDLGTSRRRFETLRRFPVDVEEARGGGRSGTGIEPLSEIYTKVS